LDNAGADKHGMSLRRKTAREAALLLYTQQEKEYKQAKQRAAQTLRARILPSNKEIAIELDEIADEYEGQTRRDRLVQMRKEALSIMVQLGEFHPRLVGSVWRGTAHKNSDIDIEVFSNDTKTILERLEKSNYRIGKTQWQSVTKADGNETALHILMTLATCNEAELIIRNPEKMNQIEKDEIYSDTITGLNIHQLRKTLLINPYQKFVPS